MTCSSIKIIYLTILWTLVCPSLQCFSLLNPNYIILLTSIQSLQSLPITLKVPEESYDQITKVLKNNPNLLNQLIAQSGNPTSKMSLLPQGGQLTNGISNFLPNFGTGLPSVKNPVTVALPTETMIGGQKFVLTNRANLYGNLFKKLASAVTSPLKQSFSYFKNVGQNQGITQDVLKLISNNLNNKNEKVVGEVEVEESSSEEEEERPKRSKKKKGSTKKKVSKISDDDDDDEDGNEAKNKRKKGTSKTNANNKSPEKSSEENNNDEEDESDDGGEKNTGRTKGGNPKKNSGSGSGSSANGGRGASSDSTEGGSSNGSGSVSDSGSGEN